MNNIKKKKKMRNISITIRKVTYNNNDNKYNSITYNKNNSLQQLLF